MKNALIALAAAGGLLALRPAVRRMHRKLMAHCGEAAARWTRPALRP